MVEVEAGERQICSDLGRMRVGEDITLVPLGRQIDWAVLIGMEMVGS